MVRKLVTHLKSPLFVWWDITYKCNLRCKQCYSDSGNTVIYELSTVEVKSIIRQLAEMKVFYIYFLGGEPFIRKDFLEITRYCYELEIAVMVNSNGWFIDKQVADEIKESHIQHIRISIDGATPQIHDGIRGINGSFKRAIQAIRLLKEVGVPIVSITPTVMQENFKEIPLIIDLAFRYGVSEVQVVQMCSTGRGKHAHPLSVDQLKRLKHVLDQKKKDYMAEFRVRATPGLLEDECPQWHVNPENHITMLGCQAGRSLLNIGADGLIMPCLLERKTVGNLREHSLRNIWEKAFGFTEERTIKESCLGCRYQDICSRECPIEPAPEWVKESYAASV